MDEAQRRKAQKELADLEAEVDKRDAENRRRLEEAAKDPAVQRGVLARREEALLGKHAAYLTKLTVILSELGLISVEDKGRVYEPEDKVNGVYGVEVDHPDGGPWLMSLVEPDVLMATRWRDEDTREHSVLDQDGIPTEWRTAEDAPPEWRRNRPERPEMN